MMPALPTSSMHKEFPADWRTSGTQMNADKWQQQEKNNQTFEMYLHKP